MSFERQIPDKKNNKEWKPKGCYVILVEENDDGTADIYSTDSPFWRDFFTTEDNTKRKNKKSLPKKKA